MLIIENKKPSSQGNSLVRGQFEVAGVQGLEPWARGFGAPVPIF